MANTRTTRGSGKNTSNKRSKCPAGCTCGRHKNKGNDPTENKPIRKSTLASQQMFLDALRSTACVIEPALEMAGIVRSTYRHWYNTDPTFAELFDDVQHAQRDFVETKLMKGIKRDSERLIEFYLDRRDPRFAKKTFTDITTGGDKIAPSIMFVPATNTDHDDAE
jgi:hypothetical protein